MLKCNLEKCYVCGRFSFDWNKEVVEVLDPNEFFFEFFKLVLWYYFVEYYCYLKF